MKGRVKVKACLPSARKDRWQGNEDKTLQGSISWAGKLVEMKPFFDLKIGQDFIISIWQEISSTPFSLGHVSQSQIINYQSSYKRCKETLLLIEDCHCHLFLHIVPCAFSESAGPSLLNVNFFVLYPPFQTQSRALHPLWSPPTVPKSHGIIWGIANPTPALSQQLKRAPYELALTEEIIIQKRS